MLSAYSIFFWLQMNTIWYEYNYNTLWGAYLIIIISNYSFCSMDTRRFPFLIPKCEGCDLIAKQLLSCEAPCQYPLRLATRVLQVDARKWLPFWEAENEKHELVNGLGRPDLEQCFGLRRIQFDLGLELRLWWPTSQGCHHQFTATHWRLTKPIRQVQRSLQAVAKETLSDHWCSRRPLLIQRNQSSWWSSRTQHTTSCSATCSYSTLNFSTWWWGIQVWGGGGGGGCEGEEGMATEEEEDDAFSSGLGVGIWHDDEEIDMNIALWTS